MVLKIKTTDIAIRPSVLGYRSLYLYLDNIHYEELLSYYNYTENAIILCKWYCGIFKLFVVLSIAQLKYCM